MDVGGVIGLCLVEGPIEVGYSEEAEAEQTVHEFGIKIKA